MSGTFTLTWADAPDFLQRVYPLTHLWDDELKQICICKLNAKQKVILAKNLFEAYDRCLALVIFSNDVKWD